MGGFLFQSDSVARFFGSIHISKTVPLNRIQHFLNLTQHRKRLILKLKSKQYHFE